MANVAIEMTNVSTVADLVQFIELVELLGLDLDHHLVIRSSTPAVLRVQTDSTSLNLPAVEPDDTKDA